MRESVNSVIRRSGLEMVGDTPWGTHFCQFYENKQDLVDILVPYFKTGLENNEFCMWITSQPLRVENAKASLRVAVPDLENRIKHGQMEILDYGQWYVRSGRFESKRVLRGWVKKEQKALARGFDGLRLTGNTFWLEKNNWNAFTQYEADINAVIGQHKMIALCTYSLKRCGASEVIDVIDNHQFALVKREGRWETVESAKWAEQKVRALNAYNRGLIEASLDPLVTISRDGKITDVNKATEIATGCSREELIGSDFSDYFTEPERAEAGHQQVWRNGSVKDYHLTIRHRDGHETPVVYNATLYKDTSGRATGVFAAARDVTELSRMEQEIRRYSEHLEELVEEKTRTLRESEERFRSIFEKSPIGIELYDSNGKLIDANGACLDILGISDISAARGFKLFEDPNLPDYAKEQLRQGKIAKFETHFDFEMVKKLKLFQTEKSGVVSLSVVITPVQVGTATSSQGYLVQIQDITERRRMEDLKDRFISAVTHELRTPLVSIKGYTDYLVSGNLGTLPPKAERSLQVIKEQSDRLLKITSDLLDYRRLTMGKFLLDIEPLDFKTVIDACVEEIQVIISEKKQRLDLSISKEPLHVNGDRMRLVQACMNLLSNASKFTPENGQIALKAERTADAVRVSVSDTGIGIKAQDLGRVFEPFAAIEKPSHIPGAGLGLSLVKSLIEAHGGHVWAESTVGKGSTFAFTIPVSEVLASKRARKASEIRSNSV